MFVKCLSAVSIGVLLATSAAAHDYRAGNIAIDHPVIRVASPVSKTGAGYLTLVNKGAAADRLLAVITTASARADLHGTIAAGNVMQMRAQAGGVPVPAGATVRFAPGGLHIMFIGLRQAMPSGSTVAATLRFEKAGDVAVSFKAESAADAHQH
ncbi:copper chaperone PCu(A)C [Sandarakinorhabdus sp.]|uniref:copper chaperone PCu(A)C n=1 Tax=Sandarakinorhabdus sp. TaxID=1916663 RepID=UPI00286DBF44|nr:copper chaperone PCu(A)C [Sandarakinorhabdus sp.]